MSVPGEPSEEPSVANEDGRVEFRFNAGSALPAGPALGKDGTVYLGTADGTVQAVQPNGVLAWSFTVEGAVAWSPLVDAADHVVVATAARRLYAISANGLIAWQTRPPYHVTTELAPGPQSAFLFGASDGSLWAYSVHGTALWHAEVRGALGLRPASRGLRSAVVTREGDVVWLDGAERKVRVHLAEPVRVDPAFREDGALLVLTGTTLVALDSRGSARTVGEGVTAFAAAGRAVWTVNSASVLERREGEGADVRFHAELPAPPSGPPVPLPQGGVCVALENGEVLFVSGGGGVSQVKVARSPLHVPLVDAPRARVVVAAGSGEVVAIRLPE